MQRENQESRETQVFTLMYVQTPEVQMPVNKIIIPQDKRPHEFLLPQPVVGKVIQLAFDKKKVDGAKGEPPGLRGILLYGHEPDAEIDMQGGREGHKKVKKCSREHGHKGPANHGEREHCLLVLNSVTSTPQWIRQPEAEWVCVWCLCVSMYSDILGSLSL
jgi:hypothetical protein